MDLAEGTLSATTSEIIEAEPLQHVDVKNGAAG